MMNFFRTLHAGLTHGVTSVTGVVSLLCGTGTMLGLIPAPFSAIAMGVCGIAAGVGLIAAPDANKVQPKK